MRSDTDVLAAISTTITVITILFSLWYSDIEEMANIQMPKFEADRNVIRREIHLVLFSKAFPLIIINIILFIIFLPESILLSISSIKLIFSGIDIIFDPIKASIIFINFLSFVLLIIIISLTIKIARRQKERGVL